MRQFLPSFFLPILPLLAVSSGCASYVICDEEGPTPPLIERTILDPEEPVASVTVDYFGDCNAFSPAIVDDQRVVFVTDINDNLDIFYMDFGDAVGSAPSPLVDTGYDEKHPSILARRSPSGAKDASAGRKPDELACFFASSSTGTVGIVDVAFPKVEGLNQAIESPSHANWPDISGDQKYMLYSRLDRRGRYVTYHYSFVDGKKTFLTEGQRAKFNPKNSSEFVFTKQGVHGKWDLFTFNILTGVEVQLTFGENAFDPSFSPDGKRIAFATNRSGSTDIEVMNSDSSNRVRIVTHGAVDCQPVWSHDGSRILFVSNRGGSFDIYMIEAEEISDAASK